MLDIELHQSFSGTIALARQAYIFIERGSKIIINRSTIFISKQVGNKPPLFLLIASQQRVIDIRGLVGSFQLGPG